MNVLLTGGAGFIGTHTAVRLLGAGHNVVVLDSLVNGSAEAVRRVERITGHSVPFYCGDSADAIMVDKVIADHGVDAVVHCAGLKAVGESTGQPLRYYRNNLDAMLTLCEVMEARGVRRMVFSSSATVYGDPARVPITEDMALSCTNPYGATKLFGERILGDLALAAPDWHIIALRYFNPVGAHHSGLIGEDPQGVPNNLFPYITQVAAGRRERLRVYGDDYATPDGTGVRDYLHVDDLARGHVAAIENLGAEPGFRAYNLGSGQGVSVLDAVRAFERASGAAVPYDVVERRPGDIATCYADPSAARRDLGWSAVKSIDDACADSWRWQTANPLGYED